jgi:hypothetical protein
MNEPPTQNGDSAQQIVITLDLAGNLSVTCPQNKIIALGMMAAAQHVIIGRPAASSIVPVKRNIP